MKRVVMGIVVLSLALPARAHAETLETLLAEPLVPANAYNAQDPGMKIIAALFAAATGS